MRKLLFVLPALALALSALGPTTASAQGVPVAEARSFLGVWAMTIPAPQGSVNLGLEIWDEGGIVAAEVASTVGGAVEVQDISKSGDDLVLRYTMDFEGNTFPVRIALTPSGDTLQANLDFADGMFSTASTARKIEP